jgi:hypothetical protein
MVRAICYVVAIAGFGMAGLLAQSMPMLVPKNVAVIPTEWRRPLYIPVRCDADENIYLRGYEEGNHESPVLKVAPDGKTKKLAVPEGPLFRAAAVQDFAVSPDGTAYQLLQNRNDVYVVSFDSDGEYDSKIKLDRELWAVHLTAFSGGRQFLITGSELPEENGPPPKLFTGIFDQSGRLVKELSLPDDPAVIKAPEGNKKVQNWLSDPAILPLLQGDVEADNDGNLFVLRASRPAVVYVLDASGQVARRLTLKPSESDMTASVMHVRNGRIAVLFQKTDGDGNVLQRNMLIIDSQTGDKLSEYEVSERLGSAFSCFTGQSFGFIITKDGKLAIQTAELR